jgi:hypothetical protein
MAHITIVAHGTGYPLGTAAFELPNTDITGGWRQRKAGSAMRNRRASVEPSSDKNCGEPFGERRCEVHAAAMVDLALLLTGIDLNTARTASDVPAQLDAKQQISRILKRSLHLIRISRQQRRARRRAKKAQPYLNP